MIGIVVSERDPAGMNMLSALQARGFGDGFEEFGGKAVLEMGNVRVLKIQNDIIFPENIDAAAEQLDLDFCVFASRHKSGAGTPSLTVHSTGNFGRAEYGGRERTLQNTLANAKHNIFREMQECTLDYAVSLEATHHGPSGFETPLFFVEIGSSEKQWNDKEAGEFVVDCILRGLESKRQSQKAIGFGGGHYAPKFSEMDLAFGHICPKYAAGDLTEDLIRQMVEKTVDGVDVAVLDEGGLRGKSRVLIKKVLDDIGIEH